MVGSMLAAALAKGSKVGESAEKTGRSPLTVCVLEGVRPDTFDPGTNPDYDLRVSALSIATQRMFENVNAWQGVIDRRACAYREMSVWDGEAAGRIHFDADDIGASALGHIVENRVVQLALLDRLEDAKNITLMCPARLATYRTAGDMTVVTLESGEQLTACLLVGADGARSTVRQLAGIELESNRYPQHALVASIETTLPQQVITWQRFQPTGPQAFLPLCGSRASMVWYHSKEEVERLLALDDEAFSAAMRDAFPAELGGIESVTARSSFPLVKAHAARYVDERIALIGDAAHTVHPLAGQGVNLGMLDAAALADVILESHAAHRDIGARRYLRRYERWRRGENALMISAFDSFFHAFKPQPKSVQWLRSSALNIANHGGPLKRFIMGHAMGTRGNLPTLARTLPGR